MTRRILYVHGLDTVGGAERDLLRLLRGLNAEKWGSCVICPPQGGLRARVEALGHHAVPLTLPPWRKLSSWFRLHTAVKELGRQLDSLDPVLVHVNDIWWVPHTIRAVERTRRGRIPILAHVRQNIEPEKVSQYLLDRVAMVVAVSNQVQRSLEAGGVTAKRVKTVYSGVEQFDEAGMGQGVDIKTQLHIPADAVVLGTVGNLLPIKGYETMIDALPSILAIVPNTHYIVVGAGSAEYGAALHQRCLDRGVAERVHFVGFQERVTPFLSAMDLYVQPSRDEAFGLAAVEAMMAGRAVVASNVGGLPEVVDHGQSGVLVEPDDPVRLSGAILELLRDTGRLNTMGRYGAARAAKRFDVLSTIRSIEGIYDELLKEADSV